MFLPSNGIVFLLIVIASNGPSHNIIGNSQFIYNSKGIISRDTVGFLYFINESFLNERPVK